MAVFALLERLAPHIENEVNLVINSKEEAETLSSKLKKIQVGLQDAERKSVTDQNVKDWLKDLEDVVYEMEDVLDQWEAMNLQLQYESDSEDGSSSNPLEKVRSFVLCLCSCFSHVLGRRELVLKMKGLSGRLDKILEEKGKYDFVQGESSHNHNHNHYEESMSRVESTCLLDDPRFYIGREFDEERLVRLLVPYESEKCSMETQIISIVGLGGVGKTTLAKLAYNHPEVEAHFKLRVWVSVSDPFDPTKIAKAILEDVDNDKSTNTTSNTSSSTLNALVGRIKQIVSQKKFLLVLDDVWTEDRSKWEPLKNCLIDGVGGSRILVTTRNEAVARMMGTSHWQPLGLLSDTDCGTILNRIALEGKSEEDKAKLRDIGMKIAEKCNGLPLAAKTVGSMLALKFNEAEWEDVVESPLWKYEDEGLSDLFRLLKLSYLDLSQMLKRCILSCIVIPQGYPVSLRELTNIWMAYGCISSNENEDEVQLKGSQYAQRLAMRSFFEKLNNEENNNADFVKYKIHDIMHDFITYMSRIEHTCVMMGPLLSEKVKRSPYLMSHKDNLPASFLGKLRYCSAVGVANEDLPPNFIGLLNRIRFLIVCHCGLEDLTDDEVKNLIHLRYLDLSNNPIRELPTALTGLYNLQTLDLQGCNKLLRLPQGIEKLRKLRHLIIKHTPRLREFPQGLRKLTGLCTLSKFVVGEYGSKLGWLENLNQLRGSLSIKIVATDVEDAKKANLWNKNGIRHLKLKFSKDVKMEVILEALQPPHGFESLKISGHGGKWFPNWMMDPTSLEKLRELDIDGFDDCPLPPLGKFPILEKLLISEMRFKRLTHEFLDSCPVAFPKLKELNFNDCEEWEVWEDIGDSSSVSSMLLPCLKELSFSSCPKLEGLPHNLLQKAKSLESLRILWDCKRLESRYDPNTGTDWDKISCIPHVEV